MGKSGIPPNKALSPGRLLLDGLHDVEADLSLQVGQLGPAEQDADHVLLQVRLLKRKENTIVVK